LTPSEEPGGYPQDEDQIVVRLRLALAAAVEYASSGRPIDLDLVVGIHVGLATGIYPNPGVFRAQPTIYGVPRMSAENAWTT